MGRVIALAVLLASTLASAAPLDGAKIEQLTGAKGTRPASLQKSYEMKPETPVAADLHPLH